MQIVGAADKQLMTTCTHYGLSPSEAQVPFVEYSKRHGFDCIGGKQDDITVVCAWVVADELGPQSPREPLDPASLKCTLVP